MPRLKLSYFDSDGGRGEVARRAMSIGAVPFQDHRIPAPFHAVPLPGVVAYYDRH